MTGRIDGFIFSTLIWTPAGSEPLISLIFDSILCWLRSTFASQFKKADSSQLPRLVVLLTSARSGICLIAFSNGLVTVTIILSTGCKPASAIIFILGKVISGNKDVCNLLYAKRPPAIIKTIKTVRGFLYDIKNWFTIYDFY